MARRFDFGSSDLLTLAPGAVAGSTRAGTLVVLVRRASVFNTNMSIICGKASGTVTWDLHVDTSTPFGDGDFGAGGPDFTLDNWTVVAVTKPAGSATYRYHLAEVGGTWTHQDSGFNVADGSGGTDSVQIGTGDTTGRNVDIAAAARYAAALSDGQVEALGTTTMASWLAGSPLAAWQFNQASTSDPVTDLTGGSANQTAITGTSITSDPAGWAYFAGGPNEGTLAATLPALTGALTGQASAAATLAGSLPALTGSLAATASTTGVLTGVLPALVGSFRESQPPTGALTIRSNAAPTVTFETDAVPRVIMEVGHA